MKGETSLSFTKQVNSRSANARPWRRSGRQTKRSRATTYVAGISGRCETGTRGSRAIPGYSAVPIRRAARRCPARPRSRGAFDRPCRLPVRRPVETEQTPVDLHHGCEIGRAKRDESEQYTYERHERGKHRTHCMTRAETRLLPQAVNDEHRAVHGAPQHDCPCGSVPEAADEHRRHQVDVLTRGAHADCRRAGCTRSRGGSAIALRASAASIRRSIAPCTGEAKLIGSRTPNIQPRPIAMSE